MGLGVALFLPGPIRSPQYEFGNYLYFGFIWEWFLDKMKKIKPMALPLRAKFMILFFILITVPFIFSGILTYRKYSSDVELSASMYTKKIVEQMNVTLDGYMNEMERLTTAPLYDNEVLDILKAHDLPIQRNSYQSTDEQLKMNLFISSLSFGKNEIQSILVFANDGSLFNNREEGILTHWLTDTESDAWMKDVRREDGVITIIPPHRPNYYKLLPSSDVVSIARVIRATFTNKPIGIIKIDLKPAAFEMILSTVNIGKDSKIYISDKHQNVLYPSLRDGSRSYIDQVIYENENNFIVSSVQSSKTGITVTQQIPVEELLKDAKQLTSYTVLISIISLFVAYFMAVVSADRLVKPLLHLQSKMKMVQKGSLKERAIVASQDEIGQLSQVFNLMIEEIERLVKEVFVTKLSQRQAELSVLQSQMNPHFLYNTLESINMLAIQGKNSDVSIVTTSLGRLLRYTIDKQDRPVFLQDEIQFVEAFLNIQSLRFGDLIRSRILVDSSFQQSLVPKLILQPLVENAIEHNQQHVKPLTISIKATLYGDDLVLSVHDDGVGIVPERLLLIQRSLNAMKLMTIEKQGFGSKQKGVALRNVHQRLRLLYGEEYGMEISSTVGQGTTILIRMPFHWGEYHV
jgi:two-component system sensor histidine kinase YesM